MYIESFCLPARMLWAGGRTCGRCRWWQRCRRWWCPESLSTTAAAAQGLFFSPVTPLHPSSAEHSLPSHHAGYGNEDCMESSIHYLHAETEKKVMSSNYLSNHIHSQTKCWNGLKDCCSYHTGTAVLTELHYCTPHERIYHYSDIYQTPQSPPGLEYGKGSLGGNEQVLLTTSHSFFACMRCINILTDKGFPFDRRWWHHVTVTAPPVQSFGLRWKLLRDSHRGLEVQLTLKHSFNEREITF